MPYGLLLNTTLGYFIMADKNGIGMGETPGIMKAGMEKVYSEKHKQGREGSVSAMLDWITFKPIEVELPDNVPEVANMLVQDENGKLTLTQISNIAGSFTGYEVKEDIAKSLIEKGTPVRIHL